MQVVDCFSCRRSGDVVPLHTLQCVLDYTIFTASKSKHGGPELLLVGRGQSQQYNTATADASNTGGWHSSPLPSTVGATAHTWMHTWQEPCLESSVLQYYWQ